MIVTEPWMAIFPLLVLLVVLWFMARHG